MQELVARSNPVGLTYAFLGFERWVFPAPEGNPPSERIT